MIEVVLPKSVAAKARIKEFVIMLGWRCSPGRDIAKLEIPGKKEGTVKTVVIQAPCAGYVLAMANPKDRVEPGRQIIAILGPQWSDQACIEAQKAITRSFGRKFSDKRRRHAPQFTQELPVIGRKDIWIEEEARKHIKRMHLDPHHVLSALRAVDSRVGERRITKHHIELYLRMGSGIGLVGACSDCLAVLGILRGSADFAERPMAIYDDNPELKSWKLSGVKIAGEIKRLTRDTEKRHIGIVVVAELGPKRREIFERIYSMGLAVALVAAVDPTASIANTATLGLGCVVMPGASIAHETSIGTASVIGTGATIGPRSSVGEHCRIGAGAILEAEAVLGLGVSLGAGSVLTRGVRLEKGVDVKPGEVIIRDIASKEDVLQ